MNSSQKMAQNMSFDGNKIQHFRNEKKITIEELSQQTGIGIEQLIA